MLGYILMVECEKIFFVGAAFNLLTHKEDKKGDSWKLQSDRILSNISHNKDTLGSLIL